MSERMKTDISGLLPHGVSMQLIDRVINCDEKNIVCMTQSHIRSGNPLHVNGVLPVMAYVEYMAQAAGLHWGLSRKHETGLSNESPTAGYIGMLKDIEFYFFDAVSDELAISADVLIREDKNAIYHVAITTSLYSVAQGRISLSQA